MLITREITKSVEIHRLFCVCVLFFGGTKYTQYHHYLSLSKHKADRNRKLIVIAYYSDEDSRSSVIFIRFYIDL